MHSTLLTTVALLAAFTSAVVLPRQQSQQTIANAGGAPPNGAPPASISDAAVADFQGVNFLENLESAFFAAGLENLTGLWYDHSLDLAIEIVTKVQAQELIHVQTAENILNHFNKPTFTPCKYVFPVTDVGEFFALSNIITSAGIGAVINVASGLALTDPTLVPGPASILAVEARHDAFFRAAADVSFIPNPAPFDTRISAAYALNLASAFIVPGSCAAMPSFPVIPPLKQCSGNSPLTGSSGPITFSFDTTEVDSSKLTGSLFIGWVNQANVINYTPANVKDGEVATTIPAGLAGLAFAALTNQSAALNVNDLTTETLAGPAPVQIS
ncbi:hypothetical protein OEA41_006542 [Lepraria neglecta]|uniref:Ferritin-like domain-containing protein n=1 Tax=Lepraria neglecta TaxID=209136 RepID=A0AAD9ZBS2_9LECA|nr:hypothetical protein OEA41_006542 [Lepraria neglecta]